MSRLKLLALILFASSSTFAKDVVDMVLVAAPSPFYISIFEATKDGRKVVPLSKSEAQAYCQNNGMKVPTREQWMLAGSALGKNQAFTIKGDGNLQGARFHYKAEASVGVYDYEKLGIDEIGTVGMSGNRAEWVVEADGSAGQCGGDYRIRHSADFRLDRICKNKDLTENVTVRCVVEYADDIRVQYSPNVKGALATYIREISQTDQMRPDQHQQADVPVAPEQKPKLDDEF